MTILTLVLLGLAALVAALVSYVASRPDAFRIERSQRIRASADTVFARIDDLREFNTWNPFAAADPSVKIVYSGPDRGTGAAYEWDSTGRAGKGRMTVVESQTARRVVMRLEFLKPFTATNTAEFSLVSEGPVTNITWAMTGTCGFVHKLCGLVFNSDKMVGGELTKGPREPEAAGRASVETRSAAAA
jgi:polyketide cyclase/dehydrase/lipid transport protein